MFMCIAMILETKLSVTMFMVIAMNDWEFKEQIYYLLCLWLNGDLMNKFVGYNIYDYSVVWVFCHFFGQNFQI